MSERNRVFDLLRGFRAAAYRLQLWLAVLGVAVAVVAAVEAVLGKLPVYFVAAGLAMVVASIPWAVIWRHRVERAFWQGARLPRRGEPARLPLPDDTEPERP